MRILADENVHAEVIAGLRERGHVVEAIVETSPGAPDPAILAREDIAEWVLLTYDRDFGDLIFNRGLQTPAGLIYSRLDRPKPEVLLKRLNALMEAGGIIGQFIVLDPDDERSRPLPT